nr:hypothetical protein CFP56_03146 [Quercus suber]
MLRVTRRTERPQAQWLVAPVNTPSANASLPNSFTDIMWRGVVSAASVLSMRYGKLSIRRTEVSLSFFVLKSGPSNALELQVLCLCPMIGYALGAARHPLSTSVDDGIRTTVERHAHKMSDEHLDALKLTARSCKTGLTSMRCRSSSWPRPSELAELSSQNTP